MGGWYDLFLKGTLANYTGMKASGGSDAARRYQRLVIGPWAHGADGGWFPERSYGLLAGIEAADLTGLQLRWFDWLLRGTDTGLAGDKPVRLFVMGANVWRDEDDWPLPGTDYVDYFLHSATGTVGPTRPAATGACRRTRPATSRRTCTSTTRAIRCRPRAVRPSCPGCSSGPTPGRVTSAPSRPGTTCCATPREPLAEPVEVIGPVLAVLHVSSSAPDTDFTAKLVDVAPDGRAENLADGILRARYRESLSEPSLLEPGRVYEVSVDLVATAECVRRRASHPAGGLQQQLPALRPQHQHRRRDRRRGGGGPAPGRQPRAPHPGPAVPAGAPGHPPLIGPGPRRDQRPCRGVRGFGGIRAVMMPAEQRSGRS